MIDINEVNLRFGQVEIKKIPKGENGEKGKYTESDIKQFEEAMPKLGFKKTYMSRGSGKKEVLFDKKMGLVPIKNSNLLVYFGFIGFISGNSIQVVFQVKIYKTTGSSLYSPTFDSLPELEGKWVNKILSEARKIHSPRIDEDSNLLYKWAYISFDEKPLLRIDQIIDIVKKHSIILKKYLPRRGTKKI